MSAQTDRVGQSLEHCDTGGGRKLPGAQQLQRLREEALAVIPEEGNRFVRQCEYLSGSSAYASVNIKVALARVRVGGQLNFLLPP